MAACVCVHMAVCMCAYGRVMPPSLAVAKAYKCCHLANACKTKERYTFIHIQGGA